MILRQQRPTSVSEDDVVIERKIPSFLQRDPVGLGGVVPSSRSSPSSRDLEDHARRRMPRIPVRARIDPEDSNRADDEPRLLMHFANDGRFHGLSVLDKPPGKRPMTLERGTTASNEQDAAFSKPDRIDRERRTQITTHGGRSLADRLALGRRARVTQRLRHPPRWPARLWQSFGAGRPFG